MNDEIIYKNVRLVDVLIECVRCEQRLPASKIGLRTMADGTIRNQPRCPQCRSYPPLTPGSEPPITKEPLCKVQYGHVTLINSFYQDEPVILYLDSRGFVRNRLKLIYHA